MSRLNFCLFVALVLSGLYLVSVSHEARLLFVALERAQNQERALETEHGRLQVEKRAEATPLRVERLARERLSMRDATPGVTHYVTYQGPAVIEPETIERPASSAAPASAAPATPRREEGASR